MLRAVFLGVFFCSATAVLAQGTGSAPNPHPEESSENAWAEAMPAPVPPPLRAPAPVPPRQDPTRPVRISGGVMAGLVATKVDPVYPAEAKTNRLEGSVVLSAKIGPDGTVQDLQAISGPGVLRQPALDAVRQWTYRPYLLNGNPVAVLTTVTINFHLDGAQ